MKIKNLEEWISLLKEKSKNETIIVEGIKDKKVLENFEIINTITLSKKPLYEVVENIKTEKVVLLVDLDKEGKRLYHKLKLMLIKNGIKEDKIFREFLFKETKIRQIEGLIKQF